MGGWRKDGVFQSRMQVPPSSYRCSSCELRHVIRGRLVDRMAHAPNRGMDRTVLFIQTPRLECRRCRRVLHGSLSPSVSEKPQSVAIARRYTPQALPQTRAAIQSLELFCFIRDNATRHSQWRSFLRTVRHGFNLRR
jgi:hypothetical protein